MSQFNQINNAEADLKSVNTIKARLASHALWIKNKGKGDGARFVASGENFTGVDFSGLNLSHSTFYRCDLSLCKFSDCKMEILDWDLSFGKTKLSECVLYKTSFIRANMTSVEITAPRFRLCDFNEATLVDCDFRSFEIIVQDSSDIVPPDTSLISAGFWTATIRYCKFSNFNLRNSPFGGAAVTNLSLFKCDLRECTFGGIQGETLLQFESCLLDDADFTRLIMNGSKFLNCRMLGARFIATKNFGGIYSGSDLTGAVFSGNGQSESPDLRNSDFSGLMLQSTNFRYSTLMDSNFSETTLDNADFSDTDMSRSLLNFVKSAKNAKFTGFMNDVEARLSNFQNAKFDKAGIGRSDFSGSNLKGSTIMLAQTPGTNFTACTWVDGETCDINSIGECKPYSWPVSI